MADIFTNVHHKSFSFYLGGSDAMAFSIISHVSRSPIKFKQRPEITIAHDVKHLFTPTNDNVDHVAKWHYLPENKHFMSIIIASL